MVVLLACRARQAGGQLLAGYGFVVKCLRSHLHQTAKQPAAASGSCGMLYQAFVALFLLVIVYAQLARCSI
eukprot:12682652-Alexandrium_andersonii.AAC.1